MTPFLLPLALMGLAVGSFLNVLIDRLPQGRSLLRPPSHCESCGTRLAPRDLVPIFSYLWLRGKCRYCGAHLPLRLPLVELSAALLFLFLGWHYGQSLPLAAGLIYGSLFLALMVTDLERGLLPDVLVLAVGLAGFLFSFWVGPGPWQSLIGGGVGLVALYLPYLIFKEGMGGGDVKLSAALGLTLGFPYILIVLFLAFVAGGVASAILLALRMRRWKQTMPFAPFFLLAAFLTYLYGPALLNTYLRLLGLLR